MDEDRILLELFDCQMKKIHNTIITTKPAHARFHFRLDLPRRLGDGYL